MSMAEAARAGGVRSRESCKSIAVSFQFCRNFDSAVLTSLSDMALPNPRYIYMVAGTAPDRKESYAQRSLLS